MSKEKLWKTFRKLRKTFRELLLKTTSKDYKELWLLGKKQKEMRAGSGVFTGMYINKVKYTHIYISTDLNTQTFIHAHTYMYTYILLVVTNKWITTFKKPYSSNSSIHNKLYIMICFIFNPHNISHVILNTFFVIWYYSSDWMAPQPVDHSLVIENKYIKCQCFIYCDSWLYFEM